LVGVEMGFKSQLWVGVETTTENMGRAGGTLYSLELAAMEKLN